MKVKVFDPFVNKEMIKSLEDKKLKISMMD